MPLSPRGTPKSTPRSSSKSAPPSPKSGATPRSPKSGAEPPISAVKSMVASLDVSETSARGVRCHVFAIEGFMDQLPPGTPAFLRQSVFVFLTDDREEEFDTNLTHRWMEIQHQVRQVKSREQVLTKGVAVRPLSLSVLLLHSAPPLIAEPGVGAQMGPTPTITVPNCLEDEPSNTDLLEQGVEAGRARAKLLDFRKQVALNSRHELHNADFGDRRAVFRILRARIVSMVEEPRQRPSDRSQELSPKASRSRNRCSVQ